MSKGLPVLRCECGKKILLIPDLKEMSAAIENHVDWHKGRIIDSTMAEEEAERIRAYLTIQVLKKASRFRSQ